jgi:hypothetical protein
MCRESKKVENFSPEAIIGLCWSNPDVAEPAYK